MNDKNKNKSFKMIVTQYIIYFKKEHYQVTFGVVLPNLIIIISKKKIQGFYVK